MKKVFFIKEGILDIRISLELKKVKGISYLSCKEEELYMLYLHGIVKSGEKIISSGDVRRFLKSINTTNCVIKTLWKYNQKFVFGTKKQEEMLLKNNVKVSLNPNELNNLKIARKLLLENNLLIDNNIEFGKRTLIKPLSKNIINLTKDIILNDNFEENFNKDIKNISKLGLIEIGKAYI